MGAHSEHVLVLLLERALAQPTETETATLMVSTRAALWVHCLGHLMGLRTAMSTERVKVVLWVLPRM